jgi:hypothetical protein
VEKIEAFFNGGGLPRILARKRESADNLALARALPLHSFAAEPRAQNASFKVSLFDEPNLSRTKAIDAPGNEQVTGVCAAR